MRYYGQFYRSAMFTLLARINSYLVRWIRKKYNGYMLSRKPTRLGNASSRSILSATSPTGPGLSILW
ncbi:hypothetical protein Acsp02_97820 [Actinoplanes sp. NBRC 103695]|nr:hypothetical protein Acsp02_97820 [Actinoplanes sp. NBRC 103695]